jgi:hypothetical protein
MGRRKEVVPFALLNLPTELLYELATCLSTPDLRLLGRVNRKLQYFVNVYLRRYRYNRGIVRLSNDIVLRIVEHVDSQADRSRLAQTSQKLYPLVTNHIAKYNILYESSYLLMYAARKDLKGMARKLLFLGGDVNSLTYRHRHFSHYKKPKPLEIAAHNGHRGMVRLLMGAGADKVVTRHRKALASAINMGHENIALMLSKELEANDKLVARWQMGRRFRNTPTLMKLACQARLVKLVGVLLERGHRNYTHEQSVQNITSALHHLLDCTTPKNDVVEMELMDDVVQIVIMLLDHEANIDEKIKGLTARQIAFRHPDPRVRMVLPIVNSNGGNVQIGKSMAIEPRRPMSPVKRRRRDSSVLPSRSIQATLWELLGAPAKDAATMANEEEPQEFPDNTEEMEPSVPEDSGHAAMEQNDTQESPEEPKAYQNRPLKRPTSNFRPATVLVLKAKKVEMRVSVPKVDKMEARKVEEPEVPKVIEPEVIEQPEHFPQLGRSVPIAHDAGRGFWVSFSKKKGL